MRESRSEFAASEALAADAIERIAYRMARDSEAREWRAILAERDARRAERTRRTIRRNAYRNAGRASVGMLATAGTFAAAIVGAIVRVFA